MLASSGLRLLALFGLFRLAMVHTSNSAYMGCGCYRVFYVGRLIVAYIEVTGQTRELALLSSLEYNSNTSYTVVTTYQSLLALLSSPEYNSYT